MVRFKWRRGYRGRGYRGRGYKWRGESSGGSDARFKRGEGGIEGGGIGGGGIEGGGIEGGENPVQDQLHASSGEGGYGRCRWGGGIQWRVICKLQVGEGV